MPANPTRTLYLDPAERAEILQALRELKDASLQLQVVSPYRITTDSFHADLLYKGDDLTCQFHPLLTPTNRSPAPPWWGSLFPEKLSEVALRLYYPRTYPQLRAERIQLSPGNSGGEEVELLDSWYLVIEKERNFLVSTEEVLVGFLETLDAQVRASLAASPRFGAAPAAQASRSFATRSGPSRQRTALPPGAGRSEPVPAPPPPRDPPPSRPGSASPEPPLSTRRPA